MSKKIARKSRTERDYEGDSRTDRSMSDREVTENRELTDSERLDMFRSSFFQSVLPDIPKISGYHPCWLTTANPRDSIPARLRIGYELVRSEEIPGWEHATIKSGQYEGCIGVNEMILAKLPLRLYESYMRHAHHDQPLQEEQKLNAMTESIQEEAKRNTKSRKAPLILEKGTAELGEDLPPPSFARTAGDM